MESVVQTVLDEHVVAGDPTAEEPSVYDTGITPTVGRSRQRSKFLAHEIIVISDDNTSVEETSEEEEVEEQAEGIEQNRFAVYKPHNVYQVNLHTTNQAQKSRNEEEPVPVTTSFRLAFKSSSPAVMPQAQTDKRLHVSTHSYEQNTDRTQRGAEQVTDRRLHTIDDGGWRRLLELATDSPSHTSNENPSLVGDNCTDSLPATFGRGASRCSQSISRLSDVESAACEQQSPSTSFQRILDLEKKPFPQALTRDDENELWRKFVFGNGSSSRAGTDPVSESPTDRVPHKSLASSLAVELPKSLILTVPTASDELSRMIVSDSVCAADISPDLTGNSTSTSMVVNPPRSDDRESCETTPHIRQQGPNKSKAAADGDSLIAHASTHVDSLSAADASVGASHQLEKQTEPSESPRRIVFTKPPPFPGGSANNRTLHIGRNFSMNKKGRSEGKRQRTDLASVYDFPVSDEVDLVENIEDD